MRAGRKPSPCHKHRKQRIAWLRGPITCTPHHGTLLIGGPKHGERIYLPETPIYKIPVLDPKETAQLLHGSPDDDARVGFATLTYIRRRIQANGETASALVVEGYSEEDLHRYASDLSHRLNDAVRAMEWLLQLGFRRSQIPEQFRRLMERLRCRINAGTPVAVLALECGWTIEIPQLSYKTRID